MTTSRRKRHNPEQIVRKLRDAGHGAAGVGSQREYVCSLAKPVWRDEV
jgi:hypothetical protein